MTNNLKPIVAAIVSAAAVGVATAQSASGQNTANQSNVGRQNTQSGSSATGASQRNQTLQQRTGSQAQQGADLRASKIIGMSVRNPQGQDLGEVNDLVVDMINNRIHYAIVGHGGVLGIGERDVAVPVSQFRIGQQRNELLINFTEDQLKNAPELDRTRTADWNDPGYWNNVGQHYQRTLGMPATGSVGANIRFRRASDVLGMDVVDNRGEEIGEIEDMVVSLANGTVHYAVLEFDRAWNPVDKLVALPMTSFKPAGERDLAIGMTREQIATAQAFDRNDWPNMADANFRNRVAGGSMRDQRTVGMDQQQRMGSQAQQGADLRASKIIGMSVRNPQGQDLGEVNDLVVDMTNNRIHYAILGHGGVLGIGEKEVAVPVSQFRLGQRRSELLINLTEQQLEKAPDLDRTRTADWNDPRYWNNVGQYYHRTLGMPATGSVGANIRFRRASDVLGMDVVDNQGEEVGEIEDLVVSLANGTVHYAVLEFDRAWNPVDKLVALPMTSFKPARERDDLVIGMTREQIATAPAFDRNDWPNMADANFRNRVAGGSMRDQRTVGMDQQNRAGQAGAPQGSADPQQVTAIVIIQEPEFLRLDTDRDGRLSREEVKTVSQLNQDWSRVDTNSDGYLTREELRMFSSRNQGTSGPTQGSTTGSGSGASGSSSSGSSNMGGSGGSGQGSTPQSTGSTKPR